MPDPPEGGVQLDPGILVLLVLQHLLGYPAEYSLHSFPVRELPSLGLAELSDDVGEPVHLGFRCPAGGRWPGPV